jgi:putative ABC transport system permease protein
MIIFEGMLIGCISWVLGAALSVPLSGVLAYGVGASLMKAPLPSVFPAEGLISWLVIVLILSALASFLPAWNATRLTVREVLAYE